MLRDSHGIAMNEPNISYKPNWTFRWGEVEANEQWLHITFERPDRDTKEMVKVELASKFKLPFDHNILKRQLEQIERHETRESLLFDGVRVFDPHSWWAAWQSCNEQEQEQILAIAANTDNLQVAVEKYFNERL